MPNSKRKRNPPSEAARARKNFKARVQRARKAGYAISREAQFVLSEIYQYSAQELNALRRENIVTGQEEDEDNETLRQADAIIQSYDDMFETMASSVTVDSSHRTDYGANPVGGRILLAWWNRLKFTTPRYDLAQMILNAADAGVFPDIELRYDAEKAKAFIAKMNAYLPAKYRMTIEEMRVLNDEEDAERGADYLI